ncbi:hypothetical protein [Variovorax sp. PAMC26660]|uniref:phosphoribosyltransferase-like protein n=1 Tax=Variovorax sp. PAMC26660 TaxID=2762322 RepID=UPI00164D3D24|nr:hypothetical protein [Variovorax sp. PAMC26660]QNK66679.1 hypothetical protein H7F35_26385 [Variovorax sp. PAMC26660]
MDRATVNRVLRSLSEHAWENEIRWPHIQSWEANFTGEVYSEDEERLYALFALTRFMYFGRQAILEMLKSLYRDHFRSPLIQRARRNHNNTKDWGILEAAFKQELAATKFLGVGNPAESGAHLLYRFRQVNRLSKELFSDISTEFVSRVVGINGVATVQLERRHAQINRYVFFDDLVGSGTQASIYLADQLKKIRQANANIDLRFMCLFATTAGLQKLNTTPLFAGNAVALFELDSTYHCLTLNSRHFKNPPSWFDIGKMTKIASHYGAALQPQLPLGYKNGQLLLGFSHNTPDNTLPIFWDEGALRPWQAVFKRFDKIY